MPYLEQALHSILTQTFTDFELVVLDNGSGDGSLAFVRSVADVDPRVKVYSEPTPLGMVGSSNAVIARSTGDLVARMDADDVSGPCRLERQVHLLGIRPDAAIIGIIGDGIDQWGNHVRPRDRSRLLETNPLAPCDHGSIMFRRDVFDRAGGYRDGTDGFEDQDLYRRMTAHGKLLVLTEGLFSYRFHLTNWTTAYLDQYEGNAFVQLAAQRIWAGSEAPRVSRAILNGTSKRKALQMLVYGTWGVVSPRTLRRVLSVLVRLRDARAAIRLRLDGQREPYEWVSPHAGNFSESR